MPKTLKTPGVASLLRPVAAAVLLMQCSRLFAAPVFLNSPGNSIKVDQTQAKATVVRQASEYAVANWKEFSIAADEQVRFVQPSVDAVIVNRVLGENPSHIFGQLSANGRVFLINPNGMVFGTHSKVNVGSLVASTLKLKESPGGGADSWTLEGKQNSGSITVEGEINARQIALLAPRIVNRGVLNAKGNGAAVHLIAAEQVTASLNGQDLVVRVQAGHEQAAIEQLGSVLAEGGRIALIAQASSTGIDSVINTAGVQQANRIVVEGDRVRLGGSFSQTEPSGLLEVKAAQLDQGSALHVSGKVHIQAEQTTLDHADNDFQQTVELNVAGSAVVRDRNALNLSGVVGAGSQFTALQMTQGASAADSIQAAGSLLLQASSVELTNPANQFKGVVQLEGAVQASLGSSDRLEVEGSHLGYLHLQAREVGLKALGPLQTLHVVADRLDQSAALQVRGSTILKAAEIELDHADNQFSGTVQLDVAGRSRLSSAGDLDLEVLTPFSTLALMVQGNALLQGEQVLLGESSFTGDLRLDATKVFQEGAITVGGHTQIQAANGLVQLDHPGNIFQKSVQMQADSTHLRSQGGLTMGQLITKGGEIRAGGKLILAGSVQLQGGNLHLLSEANPHPLGALEIQALLPSNVDVFSGKTAADPLTGLGQITLASASIEQLSGEIRTGRGSHLHVHASGNGSISLGGANRMQGQLSALAGRNQGQGFEYKPEQGASLVYIANQSALMVGQPGLEADMVAIRSMGLSTQATDLAAIRGRMPFNNFAAGAARSYPGLTLSIPVSSPVSGPPATPLNFGQSQAGDVQNSSGPIRVQLGHASSPGLSGLLDVLPLQGARSLPGQVVYLEGGAQAATQPLFYTGARDPNRIPVVYNGTLLLSPQENAALTSAQGAVVLARQEQTRSVVRTENVAARVIGGVVQEAGPGSPATEGSGTIQKPPVCGSASARLQCLP